MATYTLKFKDGDSLDLTDDQVNQLSKEDEADVVSMVPKQQSVAGSGYPYQSQQDYNDLYANAKEVGYSGLDSTQKQLFDQAYPYSKAAKSGMTLEQAHKATDAGLDAGNPIATADQHISQGLSDAFNNIALQPDNSGVNPNAVGYKATPANWLKAAVDIGSMVIPGEAEYRVAASGLPLLAKPIVTGLIGAGSEAAREGFNNGSVKSIPVIASGLTSGLGGLLGGYLSSKAAGNEAQYIADKANINAEIVPKMKLMQGVLGGKTPNDMQVLKSLNSPELVTPTTSIVAKNYNEVLPSDRLEAAKNYMASVEQGNRIPPSSISDLEAANWLNEQAEKAGTLLGNRGDITKAPLFVNQFNKASPRTLTELLKQNSLNAFLNNATNLGNKYQKQIGIASGLLPSLGGPIGEYTNYKLNQQ